MEIMVVIIVIAVLASVGSSMINTFVDQSKTTATKQKLDTLKKALLAYQADVGRMPHSGMNVSLKCSSYEAAYNGACDDGILSYNNEELNVLLSPNLLPNKLKKRWKGPYMDSDPTDFMYDAWLNHIHYVASNKNLYLWSYGTEPYEKDDADPEKVFQKLQDQDDYIDDVIVSVKRFKKKLK
jgi:type II secretory pathway pseudopilin PulG